MKQVYIGIFAHPDDESFGPSGSLLKYIQAGAEVHLICATLGQSGQNSLNVTDLGQTRLAELQAACEKIGTTSLHTLGYSDGTLSNDQFHAISKEVEAIIVEVIRQCSTDTEITFITMDQNGVSGHIDHIVMAMVTSYVYVKLSTDDSRIKNVHYYCLCDDENPDNDISFVFKPKGYAKSELTIINDITDVFETKKMIMRLHASQTNDAEWLIKKAEAQPRQFEYFYTFKN